MIPLNDLSRGVLPEEIDAMRKVAQSGWYLSGPCTEGFERRFASYIGVPHAVAVGSGTDALTLCLGALELGPGSRVGTVANAGGYCTVACRRVGAEPVYIDVEPLFGCMDPRALAARVQGLDAVVVTHLYGHLADMASLRLITERAGVPLIEDCAHAPGARGPEGMAGAIGDLAAFSFYPTKNLGAMGDAGMVVGQDEAKLRRARQLANYGWTSRFVVALDRGFNSRMDELQAAVLDVRLDYLDRMNKRRRSILSRYAEAVAGTHAGSRVLFVDDDRHVAHLAVVDCEDRGQLAAHLERNGVSWGIHYPVPDHQQSAWADPQRPSEHLPITERLASRILTVPSFPTMTEEEIDRVTSALRSFQRGRADGVGEQATHH